ncbi:MAG TPA: o-succinylbenzoate synthase [Acidimicrobiales bacterium]|nr:o-succinylbenzoate synthase [Acidimicrobiales bacterium]
MKIEAVELIRVEMPLVTPFRTSFGTQAERDILLVHVIAPDSEGWGECVAGNEPAYSSEYVDGAHEVIKRFFVPKLLSDTDVAAETVVPALSGFKGHLMAKASLEMAVLDAELSARGESFAAHLGSVTESVPSGVSVGITGGIDELLGVVAGYLDDGYQRVKLKIEPGWDVDPVRAVRERFGDELMLQVDANTAYRVSDARHLAKLDGFNLLLIEQPLPEDDLLGHAALARELRTPICLDESITSSRVAADAISLGACSIVNIKAGRVGGYLEARRVHDVCVAHGVPVWCGGMLETGLGRAANLALAALPGFTLPGDVSASERYWKRDLTAPFALENGRIRVPDGPGLGVRPEPEVLEAVTRSRESLARA